MWVGEEEEEEEKNKTLLLEARDRAPVAEKASALLKCP